MFLITTADQRFWKTNEPVLFLGEWCKLYSQKALWQNIDHEVLPYHWDDRKKLYADYQYLQALYERVLVDMTACLNAIHGEMHSVRYWRIIIGPWLFFFIHVLFDRYTCIEKAVQSGKVTDTFVGSYALDAWIPYDYDAFCNNMNMDSYNFFLYSWIIEREGGLPYIVKKMDDDLLDRGFCVMPQSLDQGVFRKFFKIYEKYLPHRLNQYVIVSSYLRSFEQCCLLMSLAQWPSVFSPEVGSFQTKINIDWRDKILLSVRRGPFEKLLSQIIGSQIPIVYLEGYELQKKQSEWVYPSQPKVILTANALYSNEGFKFWAAEKVEQGANLSTIQHGGLYGAAAFFATEEHEVKVSNIYYTWGWGSEDVKAKQFFSSKLNSIKAAKVAPDSEGGVLLVLGIVPRYSYHLYSAFVGSTGILAYFKDQFDFIRELKEQGRAALRVRLCREDYGWSQRKRFEDELPGLAFDVGEKSMIEEMRSCRLFVATYNSTTYLESFVANFPTIMFWNPEHWELRPVAREYFEDLKAVGILHDTPESAAKKVNEVFDDPLAWWRQEDVQKAKNKFCERFARTSDNWLQEWREALLNVHS